MEKEGDGVLRKDYLANFVSELYIQRKQTMTHLSQTSQGETAHYCNAQAFILCENSIALPGSAAGGCIGSGC